MILAPSFYSFKVGVIDFSMYLKNDIDDYRSEERYSFFFLLLSPRFDAAGFFPQM